MLNFSKQRKRRKFRIPVGLKFFFLMIPWAFVAYGVSMAQDFVYFYNNSVETKATAVYVESASRPIPLDALDAIKSGLQNWPYPNFLYVHENGQRYVGGAIVDASKWTYFQGETIDIRYNRTAPQDAQPVTFFKFWWAPGIFIIGGVLAFIGLAIAFFLSENPDKRPETNFFRRKQTLNLRRK